MTTYFLSYARSDQDTALRMANDLIAAGVSIWVDQYDIRPSQHWDRAVETAVRGCRGMLVVLSPRSVASPNVADEVSVAIDDSKDIIPVLIEPCTLPLRMTRMQYIDATRNYDDAIRRCLEAIARYAADAAKGDDPSVAPKPRSALSQAELSEAERHLTSYLGPIAAVLVRQASERASTRYDLYQALAGAIGNAAERESFLGWLSEPAPAGQIVTPRTGRPAPASSTKGFVSAGDLAAITTALTRYMGPIADHVIRRENAHAASRDQLLQTLADRLTDPADRAAFMRDARRVDGG